MIDKQMKMLFEENKKRNDLDLVMVADIQEKEKEVLCAKHDFIIAYIDSATPDELYYVSEIYDEIFAYWKSERLIKAMVTQWKEVLRKCGMTSCWTSASQRRQ